MPVPVPLPVAASGLCVPDYQCQWTTYTAVNSGTPQASWQPWSFDLSTLCSASGGYNVCESLAGLPVIVLSLQLEVPLALAVGITFLLMVITVTGRLAPSSCPCPPTPCICGHCPCSC
jgi:hypothetical protein